MRIPRRGRDSFIARRLSGGIPAGLANRQVAFLTTDNPHAEPLPQKHRLLFFLRKLTTGIFGKIRTFGTTCRVAPF